MIIIKKHFKIVVLPRKGKVHSCITRLEELDASEPSSRARPSLRQQPCQLPSLSSTTRTSASPAPETPPPHPNISNLENKNKIKSSESFTETTNEVNQHRKKNTEAKITDSSSTSILMNSTSLNFSAMA